MPPIKQLYAFIVADKNPEDDGIPAFSTPNGLMMPMVGADLGRIDALRTIAQEMVNRSGKKMTIAKFSVREDLEVIEPVLGPMSLHPDLTCPNCHTVLSASSGLHHDKSPSPGDLSVCYMCLKKLRFSADRDLIALSEEEFAAMGEEEKRDVQVLITALEELHRKGEIGGRQKGTDPTH